MLANAEPVEGDCHYLGTMPYLLDKFIAPGWTCVGDAGGFIDPFYSPGLDQMAFSVHMRVDLILKALAGAPAAEMEKEYALHNKRYDRFLRFFFRAIYKDKYHLMGDYDTMTASFLMDTALYYLVAVHPLYRRSAERLAMPPYYGDGAEIGLYPMRFYQWRLITIAKRKKALGIYGNHNAGRRPGLVGFSVRSSILVMLAHGVVRWMKAEVENALTYLWRPRPLDGPQPILPPRLVEAGGPGTEAVAR